MRTFVGAGLGSVAGVFGGALLAIPLADAVQNQSLLVLATLLAGAAIGIAVVQRARLPALALPRRRPMVTALIAPVPEPPSAVVSGAPVVAERSSYREPEIVPGRTVVIGEGVKLSGVLWCERLIVRGSFKGTIYVGASWENEASAAQAKAGRASSLA